MARRTLSPFGRTRAHVVWDTTVEQFIDTRTGEIIDADRALLLPDYETRRFFTKDGYAKRYTPERDQWLIHESHALKIIRDELRKNPPDWTANIRGLGGSVLYPSEWWTTPPRSIEDLLAMNDEELSEWCYRLERPAFVLEVAVAED